MFNSQRFKVPIQPAVHENYTLVDGNLMPSDDKIEAILKLGPAKTKKGVQSILGLSGYYRGMHLNQQ